MQVIHIVTSLADQTGGPARSIPNLCLALSEAGLHLEIITSDLGKSLGPILYHDSNKVRVHPIRGFISKRFRLTYTPKFLQKIEAICKEAKIDIIHDHGAWLQSNYAAASISKRLRLPLISSPRGSLTAWSIHHKALKKKIAWHLYQKRNLLTAHVIHATSEQEATDLRHLGVKKPIAIIPNGVDIPPISSLKNHTAGEKKIALFLSRISPTKGLINLISAWSQIRPINWHMVIAGPDEQNHKAQLVNIIQENKLDQDFSFVGPAKDKDKWKLYKNADLFILPTFSENFGITVAEALAHELPVITTKGAPWSCLITNRCGWWIDIGTKPLTDALREAIELSDKERGEMGRRGRKMVEDNFSWSKIASEVKKVYEWVLGGGSHPSCVRLD